MALRNLIHRDERTGACIAMPPRKEDVRPDLTSYAALMGSCGKAPRPVSAVTEVQLLAPNFRSIAIISIVEDEKYG